MDDDRTTPRLSSFSSANAKDSTERADHSLNLPPELRFDQALSQFIISQGLVPEPLITEYWSNESYRTKRLSEAILSPPRSIDSEALKIAIEQFQSSFFICSRCNVAMEGKRNHFPRCPSCQSEWFEDSDLPSRGGFAPTVELTEIKPGERPARQHDNSASLKGEEGEDRKAERFAWRRGVAFLVGFLLGMVGLFGLGRMTLRVKEVNHLLSIYTIAGFALLLLLAIMKGLAKLSGSQLRFFTLFLCLSLSIISSIVIIFTCSYIYPPLAFLLIPLVSVKILAEARDSELQEPIGYVKSLLLLSIVPFFPFVLIYGFIALYMIWELLFT